MFQISFPSVLWISRETAMGELMISCFAFRIIQKNQQLMIILIVDEAHSKFDCTF